MTTWRDVLRQLQNMVTSRLDDEVVVYDPQNQVVHSVHISTVDGDLAEKHDLVEDQLLLVHRN